MELVCHANISVHNSKGDAINSDDAIYSEVPQICPAPP